MLRRLITRTETALYPTQVLNVSLLDPAHFSVAPNGQHSAVIAGGQSINHGPVRATRRTREHVPSSSEQRCHTQYRFWFHRYPFNFGHEGADPKGGDQYGSRHHLSQSGRSNRSSILEIPLSVHRMARRGWSRLEMQLSDSIGSRRRRIRIGTFHSSRQG